MGVSLNGGFPQQPWVFLLKMIIFGCLRLLCPYFFRQLKTPKTSNSCLKNRALGNFRLFFFGGGPCFFAGVLKIDNFSGDQTMRRYGHFEGLNLLIVHCWG